MLTPINWSMIHTSKCLRINPLLYLTMGGDVELAQ